MKMFAYSVFDVASGVYDNPFFMQSDAQAQRAFMDIATNADHPIGKHPHDFTLYRIGSWDNGECELIGDGPRAIMTALQAVAQSRKIDQQQMDMLHAEIGKPKPAEPPGLNGD